jgi:hypothetical protein
MSNSNSININVVIAQLRFIGKLKPNEKVDLTTMKLRSNNVYTRMQRSYRTYVLQDELSRRKATHDYIARVLDDAFLLLQDANNSEQYKFQHLIESINGALQGIENLKKTYNDDAWFISQIETLTAVTKSKMQQYTSL